MLTKVGGIDKGGAMLTRRKGNAEKGRGNADKGGYAG